MGSFNDIYGVHDDMLDTRQHQRYVDSSNIFGLVLGLPTVPGVSLGSNRGHTLRHAPCLRDKGPVSCAFF